MAEDQPDGRRITRAQAQYSFNVLPENVKTELSRDPQLMDSLARTVVFSTGDASFTRPDLLAVLPAVLTGETGIIPVLNGSRMLQVRTGEDADQRAVIRIDDPETGEVLMKR